MLMFGPQLYFRRMLSKLSHFSLCVSSEVFVCFSNKSSLSLTLPAVSMPGVPIDHCSDIYFPSNE